MSRAVLFDFDGVLAKTMEDTFNAWRSVMKTYGVEIQPEDYYPLEGMKVLKIPGELFGKYGKKVPVDPAQIVREKEEEYLKNHHFELYPGVIEILDQLKLKKIPTAVVTAALAERLKRSCPAGFLERFDAIVSGGDLTEGKPSPAPYLCGASKLNIPPADCIVVENAPLGIESAKKAGCYCIALGTTLDRKHLTAADEILNTFSDLKSSQRFRQLLN